MTCMTAMWKQSILQPYMKLLQQGRFDVQVQWNQLSGLTLVDTSAKFKVEMKLLMRIRDPSNDLDT